MAKREDIGQNIFIDLASKAMTQNDLAICLGAHASMVNRWIRGKAVPRKKYAQKIAYIFRTDISRYSVTEEES